VIDDSWLSFINPAALRPRKDFLLLVVPAVASEAFRNRTSLPVLQKIVGLVHHNYEKVETPRKIQINFFLQNQLMYVGMAAL